MIPAAASPLGGLDEQAVQHHRVDAEEHGHGDGEARQVPLDDVGAALRGRREADAAEARLPARVHEHEGDEGGAEQHLEDGEDGDHRDGMVAVDIVVYARAMAAGDDARARIQRLLVTGDNRLKQGVSPDKVRESYEQALEAARVAGLEASVRPLVEIRLADLDARERS
jgi:hypothetical protein